MQQTAELQLVLRAVDGGSGNAQARTELARILRLEDRIVGSIIDRAPIVLLREIAPDEARFAESGLRELAAAGIEVEMTGDAVGLPKVNWPTQPRMSDLFPMAHAVAPEVQMLLERVAHLEARVAELEAAIGVAPAAMPALTPAAAAAPAAPRGRVLPPMPAGALDAVPALVGELYWAGAEVAYAIPFAETGDNGFAGGGHAAVEHEVAPLRAGGDEGLTELEPLDIADDLGPGVELEPLEPLGGDDEAPIELAPLDAGGDDEGLPAWTGRARDYKAAPEAEKPKPASRPQSDEEKLEPWTGRARDYVPESKRSAAVDAADDVADLPELDLSADDDEPIIAPTIPPQRQMPADDELPELTPVLDDDGVKRKPGRRPTGASKKPAPAPPPKRAGKPAKKGGGKAPAKAPSKGGDFSVFLSKIAGASKKQAAIELLSEIKGIDEDDAAALCNKMIIPVVQGVSKEEAEDILGQFAAHKIQGRITRKKK